MVDEVGRRVQRDALGQRGRKGDPLYRIRRALQIGTEHLTEKQRSRLDAKLVAGDRATKSFWPGSATRSSGTSTTPGLRGAGTRQCGARFVPALPDPRGLAAGPDTQTMEGSDFGLLRHLRRLQRPPEKRSTTSSTPPPESPAASEASRTTDSDAYSPPAATAPTAPKC
jgi:hypothetical protein